LPFATIGRSGTPLTDTPTKSPAVMDSNSVEELLARAEDAFKSREYDTAEAYYLKIAAAKPDLPKVYNRLGIIYLERKNYKDARDAFLTVLRFDSQVAARHYNLAMAYLGLGNKRKAGAALKQAMSLDSTNARYSQMLDKLNEG
ncbi:tetratricopeptide repeat protein, partial [Candidatus Berkelbacteria bacterium]|nr:tetratricopeptide repeat protein [Candidatus Berkelbacteria bacterium]